MLAVGWEHHVGIWRFDDDNPAAVIDGLPKGVYSLQFSEDGKMLGLGCADGRGTAAAEPFMQSPRP